MKKLNDNNYVHSDLSEFNILNDDNKPVFIDVSQATPLDNPQSQEFFNRDVKNITKFFKKYGVDSTEEEIKKKIYLKTKKK